MVDEHLVKFQDENDEDNSHDQDNQPLKVTKKSHKYNKRFLYIGAGVITLVIAIIAAILAILLSKNDPTPPSPVVPVVPDPPTELTRNDDLTNQTQVSFTWAAPENDGGEPIIDYAV